MQIRSYTFLFIFLIIKKHEFRYKCTPSTYYLLQAQSFRRISALGWICISVMKFLFPLSNSYTKNPKCKSKHSFRVCTLLPRDYCILYLFTQLFIIRLPRGFENVHINMVANGTMPIQCTTFIYIHIDIWEGWLQHAGIVCFMFYYKHSTSFNILSENMRTNKQHVA